MSKRTLTEKILLVVDGFIKEQASIWYPYKGFGKSFRKYRGSFYRAIGQALEKGYLEEIEIQGERYLKTTPKGRLKLIKKKLFRKWDGLWRIIAFDIDEKRRKTRDLFRQKLRDLGCLPIQKSVWITPQDISFELQGLLSILNLEDNVDYFISKAVTNDEHYRAMFNLDDEGNLIKRRRDKKTKKAIRR
jgi:DNA-binding transcriptional regulator PaaX